MKASVNSMRAKHLLFVAFPEGRDGPLCDLGDSSVVHTNSRRSSPEKAKQLQRKGGALRDLWHAGVCVFALCSDCCSILCLGPHSELQGR